MIKRIILWIGTVVIAAFVLFSAEAVFYQKSLAAKTLRLHVVANSDSPEDQEQKLQLRDHVLRELRDITWECDDLESVENAVAMVLPQLRESAKNYLVRNGSSYDVSATLCIESFDTREYDTFSLPAGEYHTLRIVIGEGQGKNWWCVVFPTLCHAADSEELEHMAQEGGYGEGELAFIQRTEPKYRLQFKVLEWIKKVFD